MLQSPVGRSASGSPRGYSCHSHGALEWLEVGLTPELPMVWLGLFQQTTVKKQIDINVVLTVTNATVRTSCYFSLLVLLSFASSLACVCYKHVCTPGHLHLEDTGQCWRCSAGTVHVWLRWGSLTGLCLTVWLISPEDLLVSLCSTAIPSVRHPALPFKGGHGTQTLFCEANILMNKPSLQPLFSFLGSAW